jgi:hypothetical protein
MGYVCFSQEALLTVQAPYIADQSKNANALPVQEYNIDIPEPSGSDNTIRIPPEMMPSDTMVSSYFDSFFTHIHQFAPVLCQAEFYRDWNYNRHAIPALLLEAVFACAAAVRREEVECNKWLALAARELIFIEVDWF